MAGNELKYVKNIRVISGGLTVPKKNAPSQYNTRKRRYLDNETTAFAKQYAKYSSDYFTAEAQGLDVDNPLAWQTISLRMADVINPSASMTRYIDDYKMVLIGDEEIDYIPMGTKFVTMGSTWIAVNPENISSAYGTGVIRRCNVVWNHLDWYGNILSEPMAIERTVANASTPDSQDYLLVATGYYNARCQYNEQTAQLNDNSRIIFGSSAYRISGFTDFIQEFTGDYSTVRLCEFSLRYEEPNREIDDMENHVAGGLEFSWDIRISGKRELFIGQSAAWTASSIREGETVETSEERPISYKWSSTDESVATVDESGNVTAVGAGACEIVCTLGQNEKISASMELNVSDASGTQAVAFKTTVPDTLSVMQSATIEAAYYEDGAEQEGATIEWEFSGADTESYSASVDGAVATINCWGGSDTPLTIKASHGAENSVTAQIALEGV